MKGSLEIHRLQYQHLCRFIEDESIQVRAQMDLGYAMDKFQGMTWFNFPRANFGLFIVKAHPISDKVITTAVSLLLF